ncbi:unnamed protein product, partial [Iphiclides podalirius]
MAHNVTPLFSGRGDLYDEERQETEFLANPFLFRLLAPLGIQPQSPHVKCKINSRIESATCDVSSPRSAKMKTHANNLESNTS